MPDKFPGQMALKVTKPGFSFIRLSLDVLVILCNCCIGFSCCNMIAVRFHLLVPSKQFVGNNWLCSSHMIGWEDHL